MKVHIPRRMLAFLMFALLSPLAHASVTLSGTRVVFVASEKEVTIQMTNDGKLPALVQSWIDKGDQQASPSSPQPPSLFWIDSSHCAPRFTRGSSGPSPAAFSEHSAVHVP